MLQATEAKATAVEAILLRSIGDVLLRRTAIGLAAMAYGVRRYYRTYRGRRVIDGLLLKTPILVGLADGEYRLAVAVLVLQPFTQLAARHQRFDRRQLAHRGRHRVEPDRIQIHDIAGVPGC